MSIKLMTAVYESGLEKSNKAIALAYADHAHDDGTHIYPSVAYIAWKTGYSDRSVQRATKQLIEAGVLIPDGYGPNGTNRYRLNAKNLPKRAAYRGDILTGGDTVSPQGVTDTTPGGDTVSPKPSDNHKEKHNSADDANSLIGIFTKQTALFPPHDTTDEYRDNWFEPMSRLLQAFNGSAALRIEKSIEILRAKKYTIKNPNSIYTTAVNWQPETANSNKGWHPT